MEYVCRIFDQHTTYYVAHDSISYICCRTVDLVYQPGVCLGESEWQMLQTSFNIASKRTVTTYQCNAQPHSGIHRRQISKKPVLTRSANAFHNSHFAIGFVRLQLSAHIICALQCQQLCIFIIFTGISWLHLVHGR